MSSAKWFELFPITKVQTLTCVSSDHHPIIILPKGFYGKAQRPWCFEQLWLENSGYHDTVVRAWMSDSSVFTMESVMTKINACRISLMQWSKSSICNVSKSLAEKKHLLKQVEAVAICGKGMEAFLKIKSEVQDLLRIEEKLWL